MRTFPLSILLLFVTTSSMVTSSSYAQELCEDWEHDKMGDLDSKKITESSGVVASRTKDDVFWTHNDSGGGPQLFAINRRGNLLAEFEIPDAHAEDWEDISIAPCNAFAPERSGDCLFVGDIGSNTDSRKKFQVYIVAEPVFDVGEAPVEDELALIDTIEFEYEDGSRNAEAFFVWEDTIWIFDKGGRTDLYSIDVGSSVAKYRGDRRKMDHITGADIHPEGFAFVLRDTETAWVFPIAEKGDIAIAFEEEDAIKIPLKNEENGEAIGWDGDTLVTTNEGKGTHLRRYFCPDSPADSLGKVERDEATASGGCATAVGGRFGWFPFFGIALIVVLRRRRILPVADVNRREDR